MKAMRVNGMGQGPVLVAAELPEPQPGVGELLIRVRAAGVTPTELVWYPTTHTKDGGARTNAVPRARVLRRRRGAGEGCP